LSAPVHLSPSPPSRSFTMPSPTNIVRKAAAVSNPTPPTIAFLSPDVRNNPKCSTASPAKSPSKMPSHLLTGMPVASKTSTEASTGDSPVAKAKSMLLAKSADFDPRNAMLMEKKDGTISTKPTVLPTKPKDSQIIPIMHQSNRIAKENTETEDIGSKAESLQVSI